MKTRIIHKNDLQQLLAKVSLDALMDQMIARLEEACRDYDPARTALRVRDGFHYDAPHVGLVEWMPIMRTGGSVTIKIVGYHPENPSRAAVPTVLSTIGLWDTATGHLAGLADGVFLTALRTGAASAVASRCLANPRSRVLGLIGVGAQAVTQLHALTRVFPIEKVLIYDKDPAAVASFATRVGSLVPTTVVIREAPIDLLVQSSDIVCTATSIASGEGPLFEDLKTQPGLHVNAVGADLPGKTELPLSLLHRATVCPDYGEQAAREGECQQLSMDQVGPDLMELVKNPELLADLQATTTVFDSTGFALEDEVAMALLLELADQHDLGLALELEAIGPDPLNPYDLGDGKVTVAMPAKAREA